MTQSIKYSLLVALLLSLVACNAAEFLLKRSINKFEGNLVKELNGLADFDAEQTAAILTLAESTDEWMRKQRLSKVQSLLINWANDIELQGQISDPYWLEFVVLMNKGLAISDAPELITQYVNLAASLTDQQIVQITHRVEENLQEALEESQGRTLEKQNDRIYDAFKWVFRSIDQPLSSAQTDRTKALLANRKVDFDYQRQVSEAQTHDLKMILSELRVMDNTELNARLVTFFTMAESSSFLPDQDDVQHNIDIVYQVVDSLLSDLSVEQRLNMATVMRDYEKIFDELSKA